MNTPTVSIVMSVRNGMPYLPETVESILAQTFTDFEFIILDNASKDASIEYLTNIADPRIRLIRNEADLGLSASLNRGFELAKGKFIARMDADDIAVPNRLALQVAFMEAHEDIAVCGGAIKIFGASEYIWNCPCEHDDCMATLLFEVPLAHPAVMYRAAIIKQKKLHYDEKLNTTQDYDMWYKIAIVHGLKMANLRDIILHYRVHKTNESAVQNKDLVAEGMGIQKNILTYLLGTPPTERQSYLNAICYGWFPLATAKNFFDILNWLIKMQAHAKQHSTIKFANVAAQTEKKWAKVCSDAKRKIVAVSIPIIVFRMLITADFNLYRFALIAFRSISCK